MAGTPAHLNTSVPENGGAPTVTAEEAAVSINADESPVLQRSLCTAQLNQPVQDGHSALEPSTRQSPRIKMNTHWGENNDSKVPINGKLSFPSEREI